MNQLEWVEWVVSIVLAIIGGWAVSRVEFRWVRRKLNLLEALTNGIGASSSETRTGVRRLLGGRALAGHNLDELRPTVGLAVLAAMTTIARQSDLELSPDDFAAIFEDSFPEMFEQWVQVEPDAGRRKYFARKVLEDSRVVTASRTQGGVDRSGNGGVQLSPSIFVPALELIRVNTSDSESLSSRIAARGSYPTLRAAAFLTFVLTGILVLLAWPAFSGGSQFFALIGLLLFGVTVGWLFDAARERAAEIRSRPEWMILLPPGSINATPSLVQFGRLSQTSIFQLPAGAWVKPSEDSIGPTNLGSGRAGE